MKKLLLFFLIILFALPLLAACREEEPLTECVLSSKYAVTGGRIYSVQTIPGRGAYLTWITADGEDEEVHVACMDPLCSHDAGECRAYTGGGSLVALALRKEGYVLYFFRSVGIGTGHFSELMAFDLSSCAISTVFRVPFWADSLQYMVTDQYVYFSVNSIFMADPDDDPPPKSIDIWRAPVSGGKPKQCTFSEDILSGCRIEYCEDGAVYYRRGDTLCRTVDDFASEEVVTEDFSINWQILFHDGWIYYADDLTKVIYKPDEPEAEGYAHVYDYSNERFVSARGSENCCTIVRVKSDGSGIKEVVAKGVRQDYKVGKETTWCIVGNTLYCVPTSYELQGTIEWSSRESKNSLSYIWRETGGLLAVDLTTKETALVAEGLGYDVTSVQYAGKGKLLVTGRVYDVDAIRAYYETHDITASELRYTVRRILDIGDPR